MTSNYIGTVIDRLTVIEKTSEKSKSGNTYYICKCECGNTTKVHSGNLASRSVKSCGCLRSDTTTKTKTKHGMRHKRIYGILKNMIGRCHDTKHISYKDYGAKGVAVCEEWRSNKSAFFEWAINNGYSDSLTIERKNPFMDYTPENCTFIPRSEQNKNKRHHYVTA